MSTFHDFDHNFRKAIKNNHTRPNAVNYAARKHISRHLDVHHLEHFSKDTEFDLIDDFVNRFMRAFCEELHKKRDEFRAHKKAFRKSSEFIKDVVERSEKTERRQGERKRERASENRPAPFSEKLDDGFVEEVRRNAERMQVHDEEYAHQEHYEHRPSPLRAYTGPQPCYVPHNYHLPHIPHIPYIPPMPDIADRDDFSSHGRRQTAGMHAYTTESVRPNFSGRWKDTREYEDYEPRRDERARPRYEAREPREESRWYEARPQYEYREPREEPRRYEARPRYEARDPRESPPRPSIPSNTPNLYAILEILRTATATEIKAAYRKLSLKHHPDRCADKDAATENMAEINMAYDVLGDEGKRVVYDCTGRVEK